MPPEGWVAVAAVVAVIGAVIGLWGRLWSFKDNRENEVVRNIPSGIALGLDIDQIQSGQMPVEFWSERFRRLEKGQDELRTFLLALQASVISGNADTKALLSEVVSELRKIRTANGG